MLLRGPLNSSIPKTSALGFTLIEMVMVMVILGVLAGLTAPIFSQGLVAGRLTTENLGTVAKLRYAVERLAREIRQADYNAGAYGFTTMSATGLVFVKSDTVNTTVSIGQSGGDITLAYSNPALSSLLTDEVSAFSLAYLDDNGVVTASNAAVAFVEISLTLQNPITGASFSQRTRVALRDKS